MLKGAPAVVGQARVATAKHGHWCACTFVANSYVNPLHLSFGVSRIRTVRWESSWPPRERRGEARHSCSSAADCGMLLRTSSYREGGGGHEWRCSTMPE